MKKSLILIVFTLIQIGLIAQCDNVACNQNINISIDSQGEANMLPEIFTSGDHSQCDLEVALFDITNTDVILDFQDTLYLTCDHLGDYIVRVRDKGTGNSCFGQVSLFDMQNFCTSAVHDLFELETTYAHGILDIEMNAVNEIEVNVFNAIGKRMITQTISHNNSTIDLNVLSQKGIYIVSAIVNGQVRSKKIFVK